MLTVILHMDKKLPYYLENGLLSHLIGIGLCSMRPEEWDVVGRLVTTYTNRPTIFPAFGIHPWLASEFASDDHWQAHLVETLAAHPNALVGEIGIDKIPKWESSFKDGTQKQVFEIQFNIASTMQRPVSLHCVQAHGWLLQFFIDFSKDKSKFFPPVLCHSWTGSADTIQSLLKIPRVSKKFYFGFSGAINLTNSSKKLDAAILAVPQDRIVMESDRSKYRPGNQRIIGYIAKLRGWTVEETAQITTENALTFFSLSVNPNSD